MSMKRPTKVGAYTPDKLLFRSYFGALWRGTKDGDDQERSIRVVDTDALSEEEAASTAKAAKATVDFEAPGIYTLREVIEEDGLALVSDLADGDTLRTLLRQLSVRRKLVPFDVIAKIAVDLCDAVDALHSCAGALDEAVSKGYGGITPDAFVVDGEGSTRLLEPGIEVVLSRSKTYQHHAKRLGYDAPEILEDGDASPASDVFTIGAIIWELVSGKRLMPGATLEVVSRRWKEGPLPRADASKRLGKEDVPSDLADVLAQALAVEPSARFGSPGAMREAISDLDLSVADAAAVVEMVQGVAPRRGAAGGRGLGRRSATLVGVGGTVGAPAFGAKVSVKGGEAGAPQADEAKADAPKAEPKADAPKAEPKADAPKADAPKADAPKAEPKAGGPKADAPKAEPKAGGPKAEPKAGAREAFGSGDRADGGRGPAEDVAASTGDGDDDAGKPETATKKTLPKPSPRKAPLPKPKGKLPLPTRQGPPRLGTKPGLPPRRKPTAPSAIADEPSGVVDELSVSELDSAPPPAASPKAPKVSPRPGAVEASDDLDVDVALSEPPPDSGADEAESSGEGDPAGEESEAAAKADAPIGAGDAADAGDDDDGSDDGASDGDDGDDERSDTAGADADEGADDEGDADGGADGGADAEDATDAAATDEASDDDDAAAGEGEADDGAAADDGEADDDAVAAVAAGGGGLVAGTADAAASDGAVAKPTAAAKASGLIEPAATDADLPPPEAGSKRNIVIGVLAVAAVLILYVVFSGGEGETDPSKTTAAPTPPTETATPEPTPEPEPAPEPEPVAEEPDEEQDAGVEEEEEEEEAEEADTPEPKAKPPVAAAPRPRPLSYPRPKPRPKPAPKPSTYVPDDI